MDQRVSLVTLGVADLERSIGFYEGLGWRRAAVSVEGEVAFFASLGMVVALWSREQLAADSCVEDPGGWGGVTLAHNVGSPEEADEVLRLALEAGATLGRAGAPTPWGGWSGVFLDPDGHPWEVAHNPAWPLGADGAVELPG